MNWTELEIEIMTTLACKVRVLSEQQLVRSWREHYSQETLTFSLQRLETARLIRLQMWSVVLPHADSSPLFTWKVNDPDPDTWPLSKQARSRWKRTPSDVRVYQATEFAGHIFGSRCGHDTRVIEQRHDLLLAEAFVLYRLRLPGLAERWVGEDAMPLAPRGVKNPDAFLLDDEYQPRRVVESAGSYSQKQFDSFHRYCRHARLPYELW